MKTADQSGENQGGQAILCISTRNQGHGLLRELARLGCKVVLLTLEELREADWPWESLAGFEAMPGGMTLGQITNTVTYLARTHRFVRILSLGAADMVTVAALREHMRIPGMGSTTTRNFCDRLTMRAKADHLKVLVPAFTRILNDDDLRSYLQTVPAPWLLRPRCAVTGDPAQTLHDAEAVWQALEALGDRQSDFLLEQEIPGDIFSAEALVAEGSLAFTAIAGTKAVNAVEANELKAIQAKLLPDLGMVRGLCHTTFLRSHASGRVYFLETTAESDGADAVASVAQAQGIDLWTEWARVEVAALRGEAYRLPKPLSSSS